MDPTTLDVLNGLYFILFVFLIVLAFIRMFYRLGAYIFLGKKIPVLLKRDIALFGAVSVDIGFIFLFRVEGIDAQHNIFWVVSSGAAIISALTYWVYVEFTKID